MGRIPLSNRDDGLKQALQHWVRLEVLDALGCNDADVGHLAKGLVVVQVVACNVRVTPPVAQR